MIQITRKGVTFEFPVTPAEIQMKIANNIESFATLDRLIKNYLASKDVESLSFSSIFPRQWKNIWEGKSYKNPEKAIELLKSWRGGEISLKIGNYYRKTMLLESFEPTYKDGQMNVHFSISFIEYRPLQIVKASTSKQLLKPGIIVTKTASSRPNTTGKSSNKNQTSKNNYGWTGQTLKEGDKGNLVKGLQSMLSAAGYKLVVDGAFGPKTEQALKSFQKKVKLPSNGVADAKVYQNLSKLVSSAAKTVNQKINAVLSGKQETQQQQKAKINSKIQKLFQ
jgi:hypothetical protein